MTTRERTTPGLLYRLRMHWHELAAAPRGQRFQQRYARRQQARRSRVGKPLTIAAGVLIVLVGVIMLPAPGPGMLVVLLGASLVAEESRASARALDWLELRVARFLRSALRAWHRASAAVKSVAVFAAGVSGGVSAWIAYTLFFS